MIKRFLDWLTTDRFTVADNARMAMMDRAAARNRAACDICAGRDVYRCPTCREPVGHSHENDYICEVHGFVNPIRDSDGARISGDGQADRPRVLA